MLRLRTLGGLSLEVDEVDAAMRRPTRHRLALLALLAAAGDRGISRDKLLGYLWPEAEAEKARHALAQALHMLRRDLASEAGVLGTSELRLNEEVVTSDIWELNAALASGALEQAASLYSGPFLDGFYLNEVEFEQWVDRERASLEQRIGRVFETLAASSARLGEHERAADWWRRRVALDPLAAQPAIGLMTALAAAGDRAAALSHYRVYDALVREQLGCAPDSAMTALARRLQVEESEHASEPVPPSPIRVVRSTPAAAPALELAVGDGSAVSASTVTPTSARPRRSLYFVAAGLALALVVLGAHRYRAPRALPFDLLPEHTKSLAVLPFDGGTANQGAAAQELTKDLTARLATLGELRVTSNASAALAYSQARTTADSSAPSAERLTPHVAQALGVDYVVSGRIERVTSADGGPIARVTAQLRSTDPSGRVLLSNSYDVPPSEIETEGLELRIVADLGSALGLHVPTSARPRDNGESPASREATRLFNESVNQYARGLERGPAEEAIRRLHEAVTVDGRFIEGWAKLAQLESYYFGRWGRLLESNDFARAMGDSARAAYSAAARIDPAAYDVRVAKAYVDYWVDNNVQPALAALNAAHAERPSDDQVLWMLGTVERRNGDWSQALAAFREAYDLNPWSGWWALEVAATAQMMRNYEIAELYYSRALKLTPDFFPAQYGESYLVWMRSADTTRARQIVRSALGTRSMNDILRAYVPMSNWFVPILGGEFVDAIEKLTVKTAPFDPASYYSIKGELRLYRGDRAAAKPYFDSVRVVLAPAIKAHSELAVLHRQLALAFAVAGMADSARAESNEAINRLHDSPDDVMLTRTFLAYEMEIYALLGDQDAAIARLQNLLDQPSPLSVATLPYDHHFDPLRSNPKFASLLARKK